MSEKLVPIAQHHAVFIQKIAYTNDLSVPVLYLQTDDGLKPMSSLTEFFLAHPTKSMTWMRTYSRALGLFWDYCMATKDMGFWSDRNNAHRKVFRHFALHLFRGTIEIDSHKDETELYWPPSTLSTSKRLVSAITDFTYWCHDEGVLDSPIVKSIRPRSEASILSFLKTAQFIKSVSFVSHMKRVSNIARAIQSRKQEMIVDFGSSANSSFGVEEAVAFPEELIEPFLTHGFVLNNNAERLEDREDITAKMIALLLLFAGTRKSEPFHLWFNDVIPSPDGECKIFIRHPSEALSHIMGEEKMTRRAYLAARNLSPRNEATSKSYKAGWKNLKLDKSFNAPVFFSHSGVESMFREMYLYYLRHRESLMNIRRKRSLPDHPFLFVSSGIDQNNNVNYSGEPYSRASFDKAWERALKRTEKVIGKKIPRGKYSGTTPHAGRHFYGRTLSDNGVDMKVIQECLRQRSVLSQQVYTVPTANKIQSSLNRAKDAYSSSFTLKLEAK